MHMFQFSVVEMDQYRFAFNRLSLRDMCEPVKSIRIIYSFQIDNLCCHLFIIFLFQIVGIHKYPVSPGPGHGQISTDINENLLSEEVTAEYGIREADIKALVNSETYLDSHFFGFWYCRA